MQFLVIGVILAAILIISGVLFYFSSQEDDISTRKPDGTRTLADGRILERYDHTRGSEFEIRGNGYLTVQVPPELNIESVGSTILVHVRFLNDVRANAEILHYRVGPMEFTVRINDKEKFLIYRRLQTGDVDQDFTELETMQVQNHEIPSDLYVKVTFESLRIIKVLFGDKLLTLQLPETNVFVKPEKMDLGGFFHNMDSLVAMRKGKIMSVKFDNDAPITYFTAYRAISHR